MLIKKNRHQAKLTVLYYARERRYYENEKNYNINGIDSFAHYSTHVASPRYGDCCYKHRITNIWRNKFGTVGQYEKLAGIIKCEVDPKHPLNAGIVNIDKAPRNAKGLVEYDVDFVIYKPIDMSKGNGKILYDTPNRGGMITMGVFNNGTPGNGFLMKEGYTIISNGWQAPYPAITPMSFFVGLGSRLPAASSLRARLPVAKNPDGSSIVAMSSEEYYDPPFNVPGPGDVFTKFLTYPAATLDKSQAVLTARAHEKATRSLSLTGNMSMNTVYFRQTAYADPGDIYEFIYPAKDPIVYGLGFASIRDVVSFLRYQRQDDNGNANPLQIIDSKQKTIKKALAYGMSQTGRVVKTLVYEGFNEDEKGRIVFDGINSHIGGSRKVWVNGQFSHPGDIFGNDQFPFTYNAQETILRVILTVTLRNARSPTPVLR